MTIYDYADTPHPATVQQAGYRYGCHSERTGDTSPRGGTTRYIAHPWNANAGRPIVTDWLPRKILGSLRQIGLKPAPLLGRNSRYMNFNEIAEFVEVAEKVEV